MRLHIICSRNGFTCSPLDLEKKPRSDMYCIIEFRLLVSLQFCSVRLALQAVNIVATYLTGKGDQYLANTVMMDFQKHNSYCYAIEMFLFVCS